MRLRPPLASLFVAALGLGCTPEPTPPPEVEAPARAVDPGALFPLSVGDRWRERIGAHGRTRGVTARTREGLAVIFGQGDRSPSFYRATADEIALTSPDGDVLEPILRAPIRTGARFEYAIAGSSCAVEITATDASTTVGGARLTGCVELTRRCRHPAGAPFPVPTARASEERYCPSVGRVRVRTTLEPAPGGADALSVEVVAFRVAGAPTTDRPTTDRPTTDRPTTDRPTTDRPTTQRASFGCDDALLLPSDVDAALGAGWSWTGEEAARDGCVHRFTRGEAALEVRAARSDDPAARVAELLGAHGGEPVALEGLRAARGERGLLVTAVERDVMWSAHASPGVDPASVARLFPLLRSLSR